MATIEMSFPVNEPNDRARKRIPFSARVSIIDIASEGRIVVFIEDSNMVRVASEEFSIAGRMSFKSLARMCLIRNGLEVARTSLTGPTGPRVRFQTMLKGDELTV